MDDATLIMERGMDGCGSVRVVIGGMDGIRPLFLPLLYNKMVGPFPY